MWLAKNKAMKQLWLIAFLSVSIINCQQNTDPEYLIQTRQLFEILRGTDSIQLIDVRTPQEYQTSHIESAVNFNFFDENFVEQISTLNKKQPVYVYCRSGKRSAESISEFKKLGFDTIYSLEGGIIKWTEMGLKTTR